jgi:hypothetical protein
VADGLRRLGIDATTAPDANLLGADDADQVAYGLARGRVIFTQATTSWFWPLRARHTPASSTAARTPDPSARSSALWN